MAPDVASHIHDPGAIFVNREQHGLPVGSGPTITLVKRDYTGRRGDSALQIDANTGHVTSSEVTPTDKAEFDAIVASIKVGPPGEDLPWPYASQEPGRAKAQNGQLLYWDPDPAAGIAVGFMVRDSFVVSNGPDLSAAIVLETASSRRMITAATGEPELRNDRIVLEDAEAFDRWTAAVEVLPKPVVWRWLDVTLVIPSDSDVRMTTDTLSHYTGQEPKGSNQAISLLRFTATGEASSAVILDAETGEIVVEDVRDADRAAIQGILQTISVGEIDRSSAAWPYLPTTDEVDGRDTYRPFNFIRPIPSTGLRVFSAVADGPGAQDFIGITNGRSTASVTMQSGELVIDLFHVLPEDQEAMRRWFSTILRCDVDIACPP